MWGGERDRDLIRRLSRSKNIEQMEAQGLVQTRRGISPGNRGRRQEELLEKRSVGHSDFKIDGFLIDAQQLNLISDPYIGSQDSTDLSAFQLPQLIIKMSWVQRTQRFQAKMIQASPDIGGVMCSQSFISVHASQKDFLEACCACYNSIFATYYLFLTSRRFAFDRSSPRKAELQRLPIPNASSNILEGIATLEDLDEQVYELFALQEADIILIEDMIQYTLADFKGTGNRPGYQRTHRTVQDASTRQFEPELQSYCETFLRVLKAAYGQDKFMGAVVFSETAQSPLPMRMVAIYLNDPSVNAVRVESLESRELQHRLMELHKLSQDSDNPYIIYQRCIRTYDSKQVGLDTALIIHIIKPDQIRYWTRSMARCQQRLSDSQRGSGERVIAAAPAVSAMRLPDENSTR
jgi:hypothetical protein